MGTVSERSGEKWSSLIGSFPLPQKSKSKMDRPLLMKLLAEQRLLSTQMQLIQQQEGRTRLTSEDRD